MSRRTKSDLIQAEQRRLKRVKKMIGSNADKQKIETSEFRTNLASQDQTQEPTVNKLFKMSFGYSLDLIKKDLLKTAAVTGSVLALLLFINFIV